MSIVCVCGTKGSGKDTVCDYLVEKHGFKKYAFADALKRVALPLIHAIWPEKLSHVTLEDMYDQERKEEVYESVTFAGKPFSLRWFLQFLGTDIMRTHLSDEIWVDTVLKEVANDLKANPRAHICVSDCRFENEVARFRALPGAHVLSIRLHRPVLGSSSSCPTHVSFPTHVSELQTFEVDHDIHNSKDLAHLFGRVDGCLKLK